MVHGHSSSGARPSSRGVGLSCTIWHGILVPKQGSNLQPWHCKMDSNYSTTREVPELG